jgi:hypothetical protein
MKKLPLFTLLLAPLHANLVLEESFAYEDGNVNGLDGGLGFRGAWSNTFRNPTVSEPNLTWGDLLTSGSSSRGGSWSGLVRPIGNSLSGAGLLADGATLWFSVIFDLEGQNTTNADLSFSLGTSQFENGSFGDRENLASGEGIGVTHSRARIQGVYWQDSDNDTVAERVENNSSTIINGQDGNLSRALIVGRIDWGEDENANETLTLYTPGEDLALGDTPAMAAWSIPALDQSAFTQLALQYKDTPRIDEIRFGATAADVLPSAAGPPVTPVITSITAIDPSTYELTISASALASFSVLSSETLDFANGALVGGLTQGDPSDPGSINPAGEIITTDENGLATFRMTSTGVRNFIRLEPPILVGP